MLTGSRIAQCSYMQAVLRFNTGYRKWEWAEQVNVFNVFYGLFWQAGIHEYDAETLFGTNV